MGRQQKAPSPHARNQPLQRVLEMEKVNNVSNTSDICQEELDQWSDINKLNNDADMDDWADSHNPNNDNYIGKNND
ncbi:MAG: hypothetical protein ACI9DG_002657 [Oleispira sp.]|jgi:hypothetical protein